MGFRDAVLYVGNDEIGVSLKTAPSQVAWYVDESTSVKVYNYWLNSWCTHFVYWVLDRAGMKGKVAKTPLGTKSVSRFWDAFSVTTSPQPGDLYYMKTVGGKTTHHIGFVSIVYDGVIESLDGNSGDWTDPATDWTKIGGGMVCNNYRWTKEVTTFLSLD